MLIRVLEVASEHQLWHQASQPRKPAKPSKEDKRRKPEATTAAGEEEPPTLDALMFRNIRYDGAPGEMQANGWQIPPKGRLQFDMVPLACLPGSPLDHRRFERFLEDASAVVSESGAEALAEWLRWEIAKEEGTGYPCVIDPRQARQLP